jgi:hypothetical protein
MINTTEIGKDKEKKINVTFSFDFIDEIYLAVKHIKEMNECPHHASHKWLKQLQKILESKIK